MFPLPVRRTTARRVLTHPTHDALCTLKLDGKAEAFAELLSEDHGRDLDPATWIGLMLDREKATRNTRRFQTGLRAAALRHGDACMEDVNYRIALDGPSMRKDRSDAKKEYEK